MAAPPPSFVPKTEAVGYPVFNSPTAEHRPREHKPYFPFGFYRPPCVCRMFNGMPEVWFFCSQLAVLLASLLAICAIGAMLLALGVFASILIGPGYPLLRVAGMSVSTNAVNASAGTIWRASIVVEVPEMFWGDLCFHEIESFIYPNSNRTRPLALVSLGSFRLQSYQRIVMKAIMTTDTAEKALIDEMDRAQRTLTIGLGLRMKKGRHTFRDWWTRNYGYTEAYCKNLTIIFAESTWEGSLVLDDSLVSDDLPPINYLPACSYVTVS